MGEEHFELQYTMGKKQVQVSKHEVRDTDNFQPEHSPKMVTTQGSVDDIAEKLATTSLDDLQSREYRQVLDIVDSLRTCGLGSILPLPQLVVCGNQSSGKSSVLEAITEVPFPRKENLCTRFATEIILRRDKTESLRTKIIPDKARPDAEKMKLKAFNEAITDFSGLPQLIEKATAVMGLDASGNSDDNPDANRAFTRDVLSVEISGPTRPQLTLVDLPGLIHSANKMQTAADIKLIHSLVNEYIREERTIILAVISAKDDYANQAILTMCKEVDKDGQRTLGIVTKPDYLRSGSTNEKTWIALAQNTDIYFELGWHMLKNRSEDEMNTSFMDRNLAEAAFFNFGQYKQLPDQDKGITTLRSKLSKLLFKHLKKEFPKLQADLNAKHQQTIKQIESLGQSRSTLSQQKRFLMTIATSYQAVVTSAVDGHYEHPFFGRVDVDKDFDEADNIRRLRAVIQQLNLHFASQMRQFGHKYAFWASADHAGTDSLDGFPEPSLSEEYTSAEDLQISLSREEAVEWVQNILVRTRGRELPGNFNPMLLSYLFWEQSENWHQLAQAHIDRISDICASFVKMVIEHICQPALADISEKLLDIKLDKALDARRHSATEELKHLIEDKDRHPITYDPSYTAAVQEARSMKTTNMFNQLVEKAKVQVDQGKNSTGTTMINPDVFKSKLQVEVDPDMDSVSASDALDSQLAYYKDKVKYFIAAVTEQVIERHLLHGLAEKTFSALIVNDMADDEIEYVAAEAEGITRKREHLEEHKTMLQNGKNSFRKVLGSYK